MIAVKWRYPLPTIRCEAPYLNNSKTSRLHPSLSQAFISIHSNLTIFFPFHGGIYNLIGVDAKVFIFSRQPRVHFSMGATANVDKAVGLEPQMALKH
jgi:hypothetical protein